MKYTLNDYLPYIDDKCTRLEIYPNKEFGAKLVSEYTSRGMPVVPIWKLIPHAAKILPSPGSIIQAIYNYSEGSEKTILFVGIDSYMALITDQDRRDFFIGLRGLLDKQRLYAHFLISTTYVCDAVISNPRYEGAMDLIRFYGNNSEADLNITLISSDWVPPGNSVEIPIDALRQMGDYIPSGSYVFTMSGMDLPAGNYCDISVIRDANDALKKLFGMDVNFNAAQADLLLRECKKKNMLPAKVLIDRLGGEENLSCDKAPVRLIELKDDEFWELYVWLLKTRIAKTTYLFKVLQRQVTSENFLEQYVVNTAMDLLGDKDMKSFAAERALVLRRFDSVEPLIAKFVSKTENDDTSTYFMNCGTSVEMEGLIRRAAKYDLQIELPEMFHVVAPILTSYISPNFDYRNESLTDYFTKLRCYRIKNSVDKAFVAAAYEAEVPREIKKRDQIIGAYDDGETALLVVDGLGAEYYPILLNMARRNNLKVKEKQIVSVNLPSSTKFNHIVWSKEHKLEPVRRADNISHDGHAKYEKCGYEENLTELFVLFRKTILPRVVSGLKDYKRVVVTADHGSSYLAVIAYKEGLIRTIPWDHPEDWRYSSLPYEKESTPDLETVYWPDNGHTYYVVKGYNRLPKSGRKLYGLHGGATLEERLVPFVVFTNEDVAETIEKPISQFIEDDAFDI